MVDPPPDAWGYRPGIDGLRTIAIYLVVLFHAGLVHVSNGFIGVDVFFVLSGYLVTNVMLQEHRATGHLRLRRFYARRVRRLLPAAVVLVVSVCGLTTLVLPRLARVSLVADARASLLYVANWHFLGSATGYFAEGVRQSPFLHFWSLAIEEQFYFVYPLVLLGLLVLAGRRRQPSLVPVCLGALLLVSMLLQGAVASANPLRAYYGTDARFYQLLAGACLAAGWSAVAPLRASARRPVAGGRGSVGGVVAAAGLGGLALVGSDLVGMTVSLRGMVAAAITVVVVAALELAPATLANRMLGRPTMVYLGRISYGTYLWHWPLIVLAREVVELSPLQMAVLAGVGATAVAAVSSWLVETPIRRAPQFDVRPRTVVAVGLACSALLAVLVVGPVLRSDSKPAWAAHSGVSVDPTDTTLAAALAAAVPSDLDLAATEPPAYDPASCRADDPTSCVLHRGHGLRIHLIGDSNAIVMIPVFEQLAKEHDFTFSASVRVGCPWQEGLVWGAQDATLVNACVAARVDWYDRIIPALQPDIVIAVHVPRDKGSRRDAFFRAQGDAGGRSIDEVVADATNNSLDLLTRAGARVVMVEPLPYDLTDPTQCLSGAATVGECAYEANSQPFPTESTYRAIAAQRDDVVAIDADALACPYLPACVPVIDGQLVFRNQFHLSNAWLVEHADAWWTLVSDSGVLQGLRPSG